MLIDAYKLIEAMTGACNIYDAHGIDTTVARTLITIAEKAPPASGWIDVKKRLPELKRYDEDGDTWLMSAPVLVATNKGVVTIGYYEDDLDPKFKPGWNDREHGERIRASHWMELPERPKK